MSRDRIIKTYIERLLAWEEPVTPQRLDALAAEVGLGPDDIAAVRKQAQAHLTRGQNYIDFDCLDEAIDELGQAASLDPLNLEILQTLAAAYKTRYQNNKSSTDKTAAIQTARRCLDVAPDDATAVQLIAQLDKPRKSLRPWIAGGLGLLLLAMGAALEIAPLNRRIPPRVELDIPIQELDLEEIFSTPTEPSVPLVNETADAGAGEVDIPVLFEQPGLQIEPRRSRLSNYKNSSFYKLQGVLVNDSNQEIDSLRLQVDYLDKNDQVILTKGVMAFDTHEGIMRPGDRHAFDLIQETTPNLAQLRLQVATLDQLPAPSSYPEAQSIDYSWANAPQNIKFDLNLRQENFSTYTTGSSYFRADWGITNTGDRAIRKLKLAVKFYSKEGRQLESKDILVVYGSDVALLPGEVRPIHVIQELADTYQRYEISVVEAE
ncbi:MAG: hypothetical protein ACFB2W_13600 [Leptolyngbyaceae cyanobacterium]